MIDWDYNISEVNNIAREWFSLKLTINQFQLFWQLSLHNIKNNTSTFTADPITTTQKTLCYQFLKMIPTNFIKEPDKCSKEPLLALFQLLIITSNTEESKTNSFTPEAFSANCNYVFMWSKTSSRYPAFVTIGALAGLSWWVIHDMFLCPHGKESSMNRFLLAHAIQGGLLVGTLYHPAAFGYGMIAGAAFGNWLSNIRINERRNFSIKITKELHGLFP